MPIPTVFKKLIRKFNQKPAGIENLNEDSKKIIKKWVKNNQDPLLLIEWDELGLMLRTTANPLHTKLSLVNVITTSTGFVQFPPIGTQSDCAFSFVDTDGLPARQALINAMCALVIHVNSATGNWAKPIIGVPNVGRVYQIEVPRKGEIDVTEFSCVFGP
ncbi:7526_t:CDS:2 [Funneliformis caledonium]|uniref:7526_t:CDS:1 n=1 Tax=Funneliformis caledonium TaxID=1117310 RepID=A0A9N9FUJ8_9GLOM|nr:7526_t:CDS:2 [Funneliformis caledonium]